MLKIDLEFTRGMLFVRLDGILDNETSIKLSKCIDRMIYEKGIKYFVINLENLEYIDDLGLRTLIDRYLDVTLHDGKLIICGYNNTYNINIELKNIFEQLEHTTDELNALKLINL